MGASRTELELFYASPAAPRFDRPGSGGLRAFADHHLCDDSDHRHNRYQFGLSDGKRPVSHPIGTKHATTGGGTPTASHAGFKVVTCDAYRTGSARFVALSSDAGGRHQKSAQPARAALFSTGRLLAPSMPVSSSSRHGPPPQPSPDCSSQRMILAP